MTETTPTPNAPTIAFLGAGNMAEALARGLAPAGVGTLYAYDPVPARRELFAREFGARIAASNAAAAAAADVLWLCVKPQQAAAVAAEIAPVFAPERHLLLTILAGVRTSRLERCLPAGARVVRLMPNLPTALGCGAVAVCGGRHARAADTALAERLCGAAAVVVPVAEAQMDAVTALSGSGPAYLFYLAEALIAAGRAEGLSAEQATRLTVRTLLGAARMLDETGAAPEELRRRVTSPGGTTAAATAVLTERNVAAAWGAAVHRAVERGRELGGA